MNKPILTLETTLYLVALSLAVFLRLFNLGAAPLTDFEAAHALQALQAAGTPAPGSEVVSQPVEASPPAYVAVTGLLFSLFGSSDALARLWPSLTGILLVMLPFLLRAYLGRGWALLLAFGLALDPGLVASSRLAGGPLPALFFTLLMICLWLRGSIWGAGIALGLALLSGPAFWIGGIPLLVAWVYFRWITRGRFPFTSLELASAADRDVKRSLLRVVLAAAAVIILLVGTLFFLIPGGLADWLHAPLTFLRGWVSGGAIPPLRPTAALLVYQPLALLLALIGIIRWLAGQILARQEGLRLPPTNPVFLFAILWAGLAFLLTLIYPARQVLDLVWVLIPLWALAAQELARHFPTGEAQIVSLSQAGLIVLLLGLFWFTLSAISASPETSPLNVRLLVMGSLLGLGALSAFLVAMGWSVSVSRLGVMWGLTIAGVLYLVSAGWGAAQLRPNAVQELWSPLPVAGQARLLLKTVEKFSQWSTGRPDEIDILAVNATSSLRWTLRKFRNMRYASQPSAEDLPSVIIMSQESATPGLTASYRGQDFIWSEQAGWADSLPDDFSRWLTSRTAPIQSSSLILWVRSDVFPGGIFQTSGN